MIHLHLDKPAQLYPMATAIQNARMRLPYAPGVKCILLSIIATWILPVVTLAHPMVENSLEVTIEPTRVVLEARISMEEVLLVAGNVNEKPDESRRLQRIAGHAAYILSHIKLRADDRLIAGTIVPAIPEREKQSTSLAAYHLNFPLSSPPKSIRIDQNLLREFDLWSASCVVRIRQRGDAAFETGLLTRENSIAFDCAWPDAASTQPATAPTRPSTTTVHLWPTLRAYTHHGIMHILTGYDHLLFVSALVLAATRWWDLLKVVTAFTIAHTLTLVLSVFRMVNLDEHIVEPMIAASIIFVAVQNIVWPRQSRGWTRLAVAFAFGLFHGLGFAGELRDAMEGMPRFALWVALIAFSFGVEVGHQVVVLPLFGVLTLRRKWKMGTPDRADAGALSIPRLHDTIRRDRSLKIGSLFISLAGVYFLIQALRWIRI